MYWITRISGYRTDAAELDFSSILPEDVEADLKTAAEISMGTEVSEEDITNIRHLCEQVPFTLFFLIRYFLSLMIV